MYKLIVGLGNVGDKYDRTRHNVGFYFLDKLAAEKKFTFDKNKFKGVYHIDQDNKVIYAKPHTFMNLSGHFTKEIATYYKIDDENILAIYDDKDLPTGHYKFKTNGSSAGQNGIGNIIQMHGTTKIKRIKIGIGLDNKDAMSIVLKKMNESEIKLLDEIFPNVNGIVDMFILGEDESKISNKYNAKPK